MDSHITSNTNSRYKTDYTADGVDSIDQKGLHSIYKFENPADISEIKSTEFYEVETKSDEEYEAGWNETNLAKERTVKSDLFDPLEGSIYSEAIPDFNYTDSREVEGRSDSEFISIPMNQSDTKKTQAEANGLDHEFEPSYQEGAHERMVQSGFDPLEGSVYSEAIPDINYTDSREVEDGSASELNSIPNNKSDTEKTHVADIGLNHGFEPSYQGVVAHDLNPKTIREVDGTSRKEGDSDIVNVLKEFRSDDSALSLSDKDCEDKNSVEGDTNDQVIVDLNERFSGTSHHESEIGVSPFESELGLQQKLSPVTEEEGSNESEISLDWIMSNPVVAGDNTQENNLSMGMSDLSFHFSVSEIPPFRGKEISSDAASSGSSYDSSEYDSA